ncbi:MAG: Mut7-C RNAse domain-containing protein [Bryobacteraceae bacterium]
MKQVSIRFYAELNDFLPPARRMVPFTCAFHVSAPVRDLIESLGVPHTEVDLILINGRSVDFSHLVEDGDRISVYPVFESIDITPVVRVRPRPLRQPRFVLDVHLGRLAAYLRMMGFDSLYRNDYEDEELARLSGAGERILLTRDRELLKRAVVTRGYYVRSTSPRQQLAGVLRRFDLLDAAAPFARCLACNGLLQPVAKDAVRELLPPRVREHHDEFLRCDACARVYWRGSHHARMQKIIEAVR